MAVSEAARKLSQFERKVMWRMRLLALIDLLATALLAGGLASAAFVLYIRLRPAQTPAWVIPASIFGVILIAVAVRWLVTRPAEREAAFLIDHKLGLDDRMTTAYAIIERGGPQHLVESALVEDAASRVEGARASSVAPHRLRKRHALSLVGVIALAAAVMIPERALPGGEALAEARADIQNAGEQLEKTAQEVEQIAPPESQTAGLAKEQAELGRALRRSKDTRAEVLKKLSALGERIRARHDELAATRADEIVSLAEKRLQSAVADRPKAKTDDNLPPVEAEIAQSEAADASDDRATARDNDANRPSQPSLKAQARDNKAVEKSYETKDGQKMPAPKTDDAKAASDKAGDKADRNQAAAGRESERGNNSSAPSDQKRPNNQAQDKASQDNASKDNASKQAPQPSTPQSGATSAEPGASADTNPQADQAATGEQDSKQQEQGGDPASQNPLAGAVADQAAKALPGMTEQLLKQAEALRNGQLSSADIKRLQQAAELLARDLSRIAQSKEFQQAVEQLARQISPEQIESVARELMKQEQLLKELEAAARLMMQNQQARQMVAGLAETFADLEDRMKDRTQNERANRVRREGGDNGDNGDNGSEQSGQELLRADGKASGGTKGGAKTAIRGQSARASAQERLTAQGKEAKLSGKVQNGAGGEYLYLQARPGAGAARAPYRSAYPQYRREAERSVERSKIPPHMRSVVRSYFDAINPDAAKKP
jgi:hypothetical protein